MTEIDYNALKNAWAHNDKKERKEGRYGGRDLKKKSVECHLIKVETVVEIEIHHF